MAVYSIKDLEKVTGIKAHTIRIWEKRYGIVVPTRSDTNIRSYSDDDLKKLLNISLLNRHGLKISKLAKLSVDELQEQVIDLAQKPEDSDTKIESLLMAMIDLSEDRFRETLNTSIEKLGFEDTFIKIVKPFLNKAGVLWMAGTINPAQEHFVSNLVRQKLIAEIDRMDRTESTASKRFLLFLPEGEMHELGLLFFSFLIRKRGHQFIYFGQSTPLDSAEEAARLWRPDYIVLSMVNPMIVKKIEEFLQSLKLAFPGIQILINGFQTQHFNQEKLGQIQIVNDYVKFDQFLKKL